MLDVSVLRVQLVDVFRCRSRRQCRRMQRTASFAPAKLNRLAGNGFPFLEHARHLSFPFETVRTRLPVQQRRH